MKFLKDFYNDYICLNLNEFKNLGTDLEINKLLFFVFIGLFLACVIITYRNSTSSLILRKLTRSEAFSEEKGRTLAELGLGDSRAVKRVLSNKSGAFKHFVLLVGAKSLSYEEFVALEKEKKLARKLKKEQREKKLAEIDAILSPKIDFSESKFYINPEMKDQATHFMKTKEGTMLNTVFYCLLLFAFYIALVFAMPHILDAVNGLLAN